MTRSRWPGPSPACWTSRGSGRSSANAGVRDAGRSSWAQIAGDQQALYERAVSGGADAVDPASGTSDR